MIIVLVIVAFLASLLTFYAGFGLGTLLLPVFTFFMPLPEAIAATALVHLLNNLFKLGLMWKHIDKPVLLRFGLAALLAAGVGAWLLGQLKTMQWHLWEGALWGLPLKPTPLGITVGVLMALFAVFELKDSFQRWQLPAQWLPVGGALSGFFGGLTGHQGALRSAFLLKCGLSKEAFVGTGIAIACMVDVARLSIYGISLSDQAAHLPLVGIAVASAFSGALLGKRMLTKTTLHYMQWSVGILMAVVGVLTAVGLLGKV